LGTPRAVGISFGGVKLTTHLRLVPRSKNGWVCTYTPQDVFMAWYSVKGSTGTCSYLTNQPTQPVLNVLRPWLYRKVTHVQY